MKRLFCILFAALLLFCGCAKNSDPEPDPRIHAEPSAEPKPLPDFPVPEIDGYTAFSDVLTAKLLDGTENKNLSPISVYLALAMVCEGAEGETQTELLTLLGCRDLAELHGICGMMLEALSDDDEGSALELANSVWMRDDVHFRAHYLESLADVYRAEADTVKFGTKETKELIADWITTHTHDKIQISPDALEFSPTTVIVLINAIYLKAMWTSEFSEDATAPGTFFGPDGEQTVSYMNKHIFDTRIVQGNGFLRFSLSLKGGSRMTFLLPDEGISLSDLLGTPEKLHAALHDGTPISADVSLKLPKFSFQDRLDLENALMSLGIADAFSGSADFSGMCDRDVYLSKVLQESFIAVDEKGVEAAAYTIIGAPEVAAKPEELPRIDFHLTRPFLYAIEANDGTMLFVGTVTAPTPAK